LPVSISERDINGLKHGENQNQRKLQKTRSLREARCQTNNNLLIFAYDAGFKRSQCPEASRGSDLSVQMRRFSVETP
jgi:hypothetical protein